MLSEGWDAKNVAHHGAARFTSQLLCEQVIGRGLRRVSYDMDDNGLYVPGLSTCLACRCLSHCSRAKAEATRYRRPVRKLNRAATAMYEIKWPNILRGPSGAPTACSGVEQGSTAQD